mgnify:FL=1
MAYEYESRLKNRLLDLEFDTWEETVQFEREYRELERVYRKAKAWDNYIAEVRERVRFTENTEDDIESETQKVIDYYMEDE